MIREYFIIQYYSGRTVDLDIFLRNVLNIVNYTNITLLTSAGRDTATVSNSGGANGSSVISSSTNYLLDSRIKSAEQNKTYR